MRSRLMRPLLISVILVLSLLPIAVSIARQTPEGTPGFSSTTTINCGTEKRLGDQVQPMPDGMTVQYVCVTYDSYTGQVVVSGIYIIDRDQTIDGYDANGDSQRGIVSTGLQSITVLDGSIFITVIGICGLHADCSSIDAAVAEVGRVVKRDQYIGVEWTPLAISGAGDVGTPAADAPQRTEIKVGETVRLQNVIFVLESGSAGAKIGTNGTTFKFGGGGCPVRCIQPTP
jgi:hypothetical protein